MLANSRRFFLPTILNGSVSKQIEAAKIQTGAQLNPAGNPEKLRLGELTMEKKYVAILLTLWIGLILFVGINKAQGNLFDTKKTREEVEIMKGILQSTLKIAFRGAQSGGEETHFWEGPSPHISGCYLYGQGAVFTLSAPSSYLAAMPKLAMLAPRPPKPPSAPSAPKIAAHPADKIPPVPPVPPAPAVPPHRSWPVLMGIRA